MDARGYVIILHLAMYSVRDIAGRFGCIYERRASRCRPTSKGQCEKPLNVGR